LRGLCRFTESLTWFDKALEEDPKNRAALEGATEVLLTLREYRKAYERIDNAVTKQPSNPYFRAIRARTLGGLGKTDDAFAELRKAWEMSTAKGKQGDNRVLLTWGVLHLKLAQTAEPNSATAIRNLVLAEAKLREGLEIAPLGYKPRFRNMLIHVLWEKGRASEQCFLEAYDEALRSVSENRFEEKNHQYLLFASLAVAKWDKAYSSGITALSLARQLVVPKILCDAGYLLSGIFLEQNILQLKESFNKWQSYTAQIKEFDSSRFNWSPARKRIEIGANQLPATYQNLFNEVLETLDLARKQQKP